MSIQTICMSMQVWKSEKVEGVLLKVCCVVLVWIRGIEKLCAIVHSCKSV